MRWFLQLQYVEVVELIQSFEQLSNTHSAKQVVRLMNTGPQTIWEHEVYFVSETTSLTKATPITRITAGVSG